MLCPLLFLHNDITVVFDSNDFAMVQVFKLSLECTLSIYTIHKNILYYIIYYSNVVVYIVQYILVIVYEIIMI